MSSTIFPVSICLLLVQEGEDVPRLKGGENLDTVYIEPEKPYLSAWGVYPEDDKGKK
jgi:hypothetical protein